MKTAALNSDEMLKTMVAEAVQQQTQIRAAVRDIMLKALQARELGLGQINSVVSNVTKGVNAGLGDKGNVEKVLAEAVAGMDVHYSCWSRQTKWRWRRSPRAAPASKTPASRKRCTSSKSSRTGSARGSSRARKRRVPA
jgi:Family of unknown function (DUF6781)